MKQPIVFSINLLIILFVNTSIFAHADIDTTVIDTTIIPNTTIENSNLQTIVDTSTKEKKAFLSFLKEDGNKPKKAAFYSAVIPGGGQFFNKQYWKAPIAFGAVGTAAYFVYDNTNEYRIYRNAYRIRVDGDSTTIDDFANNPNATEEALIDARDNARKWMEQSYIALVVVYGLNILEAYTAAHLKDFNIDDDLSLHWQPTIKMQNSLVLHQNMEFGVMMQFRNRTPNIILNF